MRFQQVIFDLDGTLLDTGRSIKTGVARTLAHFGLPVPPEAELAKYIGPPLHESFRQFCPFTGAQVEEAVAFYRDYYEKHCLFISELYPGIGHLVDALHGSGAMLLVATSKLERFAVQMLEHCGLGRYFACIAGSSTDGSRGKKAQVIRYALDRCGISDVSGAVMVGDRKYDILGAKALGMASIGLLHGYGSRAELQEAGADRLFATAAEAEAFLLEQPATAGLSAPAPTRG